jgi:hypothetical protein
MRSNFHDVLKVVNGVVLASGPLKWGKGESKAIITVIINQNGKIVGAASSPPILTKSQKEWNLIVPSAIPGKKFKKGRARATSEIWVIGSGGSVPDPYQWGQSVKLEE